MTSHQTRFKFTQANLKALPANDSNARSTDKAKRKLHVPMTKNGKSKEVYLSDDTDIAESNGMCNFWVDICTHGTEIKYNIL